MKVIDLNFISDLENEGFHLLKEEELLNRVNFNESNKNIHILYLLLLKKENKLFISMFNKIKNNNCRFYIKNPIEYIKLSLKENNEEISLFLLEIIKGNFIPENHIPLRIAIEMDSDLINNFYDSWNGMNFSSILKTSIYHNKINLVYKMIEDNKYNFEYGKKFPMHLFEHFIKNNQMDVFKNIFNKFYNIKLDKKSSEELFKIAIRNNVENEIFNFLNQDIHFENGMLYLFFLKNNKHKEDVFNYLTDPKFQNLNVLKKCLFYYFENDFEKFKLLSMKKINNNDLNKELLYSLEIFERKRIVCSSFAIFSQEKVDFLYQKLKSIDFNKFTEQGQLLKNARNDLDLFKNFINNNLNIINQEELSFLLCSTSYSNKFKEITDFLFEKIDIIEFKKYCEKNKLINIFEKYENIILNKSIFKELDEEIKSKNDYVKKRKF